MRYIPRGPQDVDADSTEWADRLQRAPAASSPKIWTCPNCDAILGISDYE